MTQRARHWQFLAGLAIASLVSLVLLVAWLNVRGEDSEPLQPAGQAAPQDLITRGAYLARAGDCAACHTARGGAPYAGGRGIQTQFGTVFSSNLTPDQATGIGSWTPQDFWRALHNGRAKDGRLLYPAFPYTSYTFVTRADADAIFAFLQSQPPVASGNRRHEMRFPYNQQWALAVWRALYFRAGALRSERGKSEQWNRGAYLVRGLGHCAECHSTRNALGSTEDGEELRGGLIPVQNWYAPPLSFADDIGPARRSVQDVVDLLKTGTSARGSVLGPMAEVVYRSTQYLDDSDLRAVATFLEDLPPTKTASPPAGLPDPAVMTRGASVYKNNCERCHGESGQGEPGAYPSFAGSRKFRLHAHGNVVRIVVRGGFPPTTQGNPRPFGMPPFGQTLSDSDVAAVVTFISNTWGNQAGPISELDVIRQR